MSITFLPVPSFVGETVTGSNGILYEVTALSPLSVQPKNNDSDLVDNGNHTFTHTDEHGNLVTIDFGETNTTLVDNGDGTFTYTNELGAITVINKASLSSVSWNGATRTLNFLKDDGTSISVVLNEAAVTNTIAGNRIATYTGTDGTASDIDETVTSIVDNGNGTFTYTNEAGVPVNITNKDVSGISFDNTTRILTLSLINGSNLSTVINEPSVTSTVAGNTIAAFVKTGGVSTPIRETITNFSYNSITKELTYVDESGASSVVNLSALTTDVYVGGGSLAGAVLTLTDGSGATPDIVLDLSGLLSTWVDNGNGTYTHDDGTGATFNLDLNASNLPYNNTTSGLASTNLQSAVNELNNIASKSVITNNGNGTYTHNDGKGVTVLIDTRSSSNPYDNTTSGLTASTVKDAIDELKAEAFAPVITDNSDGTYTHSDGQGTSVIINTKANANPYDNTTSGLAATTVQSAIDELDNTIYTSVVTDNGDGTYTHNDGNGNLVTLDTRATSNPYTNTISGLLSTNVQSAIDEIAGGGGATDSLIDNANGTYTHTAVNGTVITFDTRATSNPYSNGGSGMAATNVQAAIDELAAGFSKSSITNNADGTYTHTAGDGTTTIIDTKATSNPYSNTTSGLASTNVQAAIDELAGGGGSTDILTNNADGTYTHTAVNGTAITIDTNASANPYSNTTSGLASTNVQAAIDELAGGGGNSDSIVDNGDGTYTHTAVNGTAITIDTNASANPYDNTTSGLAAVTVQSAINELAAGFSKSVIVNNADGTYTHTSGDGTVVTLDTRATSNPYNNGASGLTATTVQAAIDEVATSSSTTNSGLIEIATVTETVTGTDATRAVTPADLMDVSVTPVIVDKGFDNTADASAAEIAAYLTTDTLLIRDTSTGDTRRIQISDLPGGAAVASATTSVQGIVELATVTETVTGTDATRAVTPADLMDVSVTPVILDGGFDNTSDASAAEIAAYLTTDTLLIRSASTGDTRRIQISDLPGGAGVPVATTSVQGIVELATNLETSTGTDSTRAVTPVKLMHPTVTPVIVDKGFDNTSDASAAEIAAYLTTDTLLIRSATTGDTRRIQISDLPGGAGVPVATTSVQGIVELATNTETSTGTDSTRAVTPVKLMHPTVTPVIVDKGFDNTADASAAEIAAYLTTDTLLIRSATTGDTRRIQISDLPGGAGVPVASKTVQGIVELTTALEVQTGTDDTRAVTPAALMNNTTLRTILNNADTVTNLASAAEKALYTTSDTLLIRDTDVGETRRIKIKDLPGSKHYLTSNNGGSAPATAEEGSTMCDDAGNGSFYKYMSDGSNIVWVQISA